MSATASHPALEALVDAYHRRHNGRLVLRREGVERSVVLSFRKVLFANSTEKKDRLELVLATRKLLKKEEILRLAGKAKDAGVDFMTVVQREGVLKDIAMFDIMSDRARDIISDLVTWKDANVEYDPRNFAAEPILPLNSNLVAILIDGMMSRFGVEECRTLLGAEDQIPVLQDRAYLLRDLRASTHARLAKTVVDLIDGDQTIVDIVNAVEGEEMQALKMLAALKLMRGIDLPDAHHEPVVHAEALEPDTEEEVEVVAESFELSQEEKSALSNIFEGATNLLEDEGGEGDDELEIVVDDDDGNDEAQFVAAPEDDEDEDDLPVEPDDLPIEPDAEDEDDDDIIIGEAEDEPGEATTAQVQVDFNALLDIDPEEGAKLYSAGLDLFQKGRISSAINVYQQAIDKDPSIDEYYTALGVAHLEDAADAPRDEQAAIRNFLEAVKLSPEVPKNHFYLGKVYEERGETDAAIDKYREALSHDADYAPAKQALEALEGGGDEPQQGDKGFLRKLFGR